MKTVNSLSGGKTSSYIAANYPADYNVFALVRTDDKSCLYPDKKLRQMVSDKIGVEFIGTLEQDNIIKVMLDLEQFIGKEITALNFLHKYADNELTNAESIRRMRAKLQEEEPGLRGEAYKIRKGKLQEEWRKNLGYENN